MSVYIPFDEKKINALLSLLHDKNKNSRGKLNFQQYQIIQSNLRKAKKGINIYRDIGVPVSSMDDWGLIASTLKVRYHAGLEAGNPDPKLNELYQTIKTWMDNNTFDPDSDETKNLRLKRRNSKKREVVRIATYSIDGILSLVQMVDKKKDAYKIELSGYMVNVYSKRLQCFKTHGVNCVSCGLKGEFFSLEYYVNDNDGKEHPHLNLYGVEDGIEVLMTHDHIYPLSSGGKNHLSNMQTMCSPCNSVKGIKVMKNETRMPILP